MNCEDLYKKYKHDDELELIKNDAGSTYFSYYARQHKIKDSEYGNFIKAPHSGVLPCFCKHNMHILDDGNKNFTFELFYSGKKHTMPICKEWVKTTLKDEAESFGASKGIVITNVVFKFFIIWIMTLVGAKT